MKGKVKWFNQTKGYGFLTDETGEDFFVHFSAIISTGKQTLLQGQAVEFTLVESDKGIQASHVKPMDS